MKIRTEALERHEGCSGTYNVGAINVPNGCVLMIQSRDDEGREVLTSQYLHHTTVRGGELWSGDHHVTGNFSMPHLVIDRCRAQVARMMDEGEDLDVELSEIPLEECVEKMVDWILHTQPEDSALNLIESKFGASEVTISSEPQDQDGVSKRAERIARTIEIILRIHDARESAEAFDAMRKVVESEGPEFFGEEDSEWEAQPIGSLVRTMANFIVENTPAHVVLDQIERSLRWTGLAETLDFKPVENASISDRAESLVRTLEKLTEVLKNEQVFRRNADLQKYAMQNQRDEAVKELVTLKDAQQAMAVRIEEVEAEVGAASRASLLRAAEMFERHGFNLGAIIGLDAEQVWARLEETVRDMARARREANGLREESAPSPPLDSSAVPF